MKEGAPIPTNEKVNQDHTEVNFHEVARDRASLRKTKRETPEDFQDEVEEAFSEVDRVAKGFKIEHKKDEEGNLTEHLDITSAKKRLKLDKEKAESSLGLNLEKIETEIPEFKEIDDLVKKLDDTKKFELNLLNRKKNDPYAKTLDSILNTISKEKFVLQEKLKLKEKDSPLSVRSHDLVSYKQGLLEEGHIAETPSVTEVLEKISRRTIVGKPIFLHGPTGTGKTSLARLASSRTTGKNSEMVYCNPQTRETHIWGKTGIKPTEGGGIETVDIFGPLTKAMLEGKTVIFDEFTALPTEQMVFIKGVFNAKVGDEINVVGNGKIKISPGFQMIFTANLKSDKNPERQALPPEIAREFEQNNLEVGYSSKEESYDIMLARLMNPDGSVDLSVYDLDVTLPKLCEAMEEVQLAYTEKQSSESARRTGTLGVNNKLEGLKKLVLTQGTIEAILDDWKTEIQINKDHSSFSEFLDSSLRTGLTFKEYPEPDRVLTAKILASKGFLRTLSEKDLGLPQGTLDFDKNTREDKDKIDEQKTKSGKIARNTLTEISRLDPFKVRSKNLKDSAKDLLGEEVAVPEAEESTEVAKQAMTDFLLSTYKGWNVSQDKLDKINWKEIHSSSIDYKAKKDDIDSTKYGEYIMNPDTDKIDWNSIPQNKIKTIKLPDNLNGKSLAEVGEYIQSTFGNTYKLPGLEYYKYILENPNKAPDSLKDGNYHFFYGSLFRNSGGVWSVPYVNGSSSGFNRSGNDLDNGWYDDYRVVLLEN